MLKKFLQRWWFWIFFAVIIVMASYLRLSNLGSNPSSLYWEEAALGYDAYSLLKTGKDHHGKSWPIVAFTSFGDFKPSGYFYALLPSIALFGLTPEAVRLPSAIAGTLIVLGLGILARELSSNKNDASKLQLLAMVVAAISPWAIQFSRGGWEVNLASCLVLWGVVAGVNVLKRVSTKKIVLMVATAILFALSMYTYHATRLIAPILMLGMLFWWWVSEAETSIKKLFTPTVIRKYIVAGLFFIVLILPVLVAARVPVTQQRFAETSLFTGQAVAESNLLRESVNNSWWSKILFHRWIIAIRVFAENYLSHFSLQYLFVSGDQNPRHSVQFVGLFYPLDAVFMIIGIGVWIWKKRQIFVFLCLWFVIGIVPAALTKAAPHALRTLPIMPVYILLITTGIFWSVQFIQQKIQFKKAVFNTIVYAGLIATIAGNYGFQFIGYWHFYTHIYPVVYVGDWQDGYQEMVESVNKAKTETPNKPIMITREQGRPAMFYWFFSNTDPRQVQAEEATAPKDQAEFLSFQNIRFINSVNEAKPGIIASSPQGKLQLEAAGHQLKSLSSIKNRNKQIVWEVYELLQ